MFTLNLSQKISWNSHNELKNNWWKKHTNSIKNQKSITEKNEHKKNKK